MRRTSPFLLVVAISLLAPAGAATQESVQRDDAATLRALVAGDSDSERDRKVVLHFLDRSEVRDAAAERGIDVDALKDGVATLDAADAADLAARVRATEDDLAQVGGDTWVISSTTLIILLLVIILIIVA
ncbi:MAG TPA: hypothetical protein VK849_15605 [Longimicrobiales bacterium]|nr:hypothetical protein [Longimicrobiales bacterium]